MLINGEDISAIEGKYVFLDNDFLGAIFEDEHLFEDILKIFSKCYLTLDPLTEFEFLRDVWLPKRRSVKEDFVSSPIFLPQINHQELFDKIQGNALILSKIYSHQQSKKNEKGAGWSTIDLFLAARVMNFYSNSILVTGNKKDFPTSVFDLMAVINIEQPDGGIRCFSVLQFNMKNFLSCQKLLEDFQSK